ncbi:hypothetical protein SNE35_28770 [Paucibacter sp. R3-3]|uniref:DUF465 domain-containing protein n=1 Tax=Roseateles agri TaxID=3098619 RepID=A0ABU5DQE2_9BURK|nr:hypothetical protein [Paucibacter sp. R3-3]MDY0748528.1 hypothetical protein [Paucibacter sp. R3-3]
MSAISAICFHLRRAWLELEILRLSERHRELRHGIALDQAAAAVHQQHFSSSPVLRGRMHDEKQQLAKVTTKLNERLYALAKLELRA